MIPRVKEHHTYWLNAIREGRKAGSDISPTTARRTEIAILGVIALKFPNTKLQWDTANMCFTNSDEANKYANPPYRTGWSL